MSRINYPKYIIIHHTGGTDYNPLADTSNQTFQIVDAYHKERFNFISSLGHYIGYHYFIDKKGNITQGRANNEEGAHTIGHNNDSIGVCLAGNFDKTVPSYAQEQSLQMLLVKIVKENNIKSVNILPHRAFAQKTCYGKNLSDYWGKDQFLIGKKIVEERIASSFGGATGTPILNI